MVTISDKFSKGSSGTRPTPTILSAQKGVGDSSLTADDLTGWATDTPVTFVLYKVDTSGKEVANSRTDWKGIVVGNTITQLVLTAGTDTIYPSGSPVIAVASARWANDLVSGLTTTLNQNGTLIDSIVTTSKIADASITNSKLSTATNEIGGAWQSWTPTVNNFTLGNGTILAAHKQIGKIDFYRLRLTLGSTSDVTGNLSFSPPVAPNAELYLTGTEGYLVGQAKYLNSTIAAFNGPVYVSSATQFNFAVYAPSGGYIAQANVNASIPFDFATDDAVIVEGFYEVA